jgi:hypothetical protein
MPFDRPSKNGRIVSIESKRGASELAIRVERVDRLTSPATPPTPAPPAARPPLAARR